jgi:hypothetical protein
MKKLLASAFLVVLWLVILYGCFLAAWAVM